MQPRGATPRARSGAEAGRTPCPKGGSQEELPHVRGQGQRQRVPDCNSTGTAEKSYPASEVRGSKERSYPTPPSLRPGAAGGRSYHSPPRPRPGAAARRRNPMPEARGSSREDQPHVQGAVAAWAQAGLEELSMLKVRKGSGEEIPLIQGKEQRLCFAGAAMKRYPTPKVRETQVRR